ncbi:MAG: SWIM zinc finger family protein [Pseudomonadota bacterium]
MGIDLQNVEALAPDQASLKAASKLLKPQKWPLLGQNPAAGLIWGECQGSGANPYRVIADTDDLGYKCTCPSRKFPCKHSLALMWMYAEEEAAFISGDVPEWVTDWVGRRRKAAGAAESEKPPGPAKSLAAAQQDEPEAAPDPRKQARQKAQAEKRARDNLRAVRNGLDELEQWIADQLRLGLAGFLNEMTDRCRQIAARMIDAKAGGLAGRLDEMPARVLVLKPEERPDALISELGKLVLLARAWRLDPEDPDLKRTVTSSETRDAVLDDPETPRVNSVWEVLDERVVTRRDGLIAQSTWLLNLRPGPQRFALLLDFFPAATGRRGNSFTAGERFQGELAFYRAGAPLRALIADRRPVEEDDGPAVWPQPGPNGLLGSWQAALDHAPWTLATPVLLPDGRICRTPGGEIWWRAGDGSGVLPVLGDVPEIAFGTNFAATAGIWNGVRCDLLAATSADWGTITLHG